MLKQPSLPSSDRPVWYRFVCTPVVLGTLCGIISSLGYTAANVCLRSVIRVDPAWVMTLKAVPTFLVAIPWVIWLRRRGESLLSDRKSVGALILASLFGHFCGNLALQWSFSMVGMALAVPLTLGSMIVSGAVLGRVILGEAITVRVVVSSAILIAAVLVLSTGAPEAHASVALEQDTSREIYFVAGGVAAACLAGMAYTVLGVAIRRCSARGMPQGSALLIVSTMGILSLGTYASGTSGWHTLLGSTPAQWWAMIWAGIFNAIAFAALIKALQLTTLVFVNGVNASQAALAAMAGVIFFDEAVTQSLYLGVVLNVVGLALMKKKRPQVRPES